MKTAEIAILEQIKHLRHCLVLYCERCKTEGIECHDWQAICNAMVTAERLAARVVDDANS